MESWLKRSINQAGASDSQSRLNKNVKIQFAVKYRQYKDSYAVMGFICNHSKPPKAVCFFCGDTLSNNSMKPSHLQRHLTTKHACHVGEPSSFFQKKFSKFRSSQDVIRKVSATSERALQASDAVSLPVAKAKMPFTIVEKLLLPASKVLAETMTDKTVADKFNAVPLSNTMFLNLGC